MLKKHELTEKQELLLSKLREHGRVKTACKEAGICRMTYYRWLKLPIFKKALKELFITPELAKISETI